MATASDMTVSVSLEMQDIYRVARAVRFAERFDRSRGNGADPQEWPRYDAGPCLWPLVVTGAASGDGMYPIAIQEVTIPDGGGAPTLSNLADGSGWLMGTGGLVYAVGYRTIGIVVGEKSNEPVFAASEISERSSAPFTAQLTTNELVTGTTYKYSWNSSDGSGRSGVLNAYQYAPTESSIPFAITPSGTKVLMWKAAEAPAVTYSFIVVDDASLTRPGMMTRGIQDFKGRKSFDDGIAASGNPPNPCNISGVTFGQDELDSDEWANDVLPTFLVAQVTFPSQPDGLDPTDGVWITSTTTLGQGLILGGTTFAGPVHDPATGNFSSLMAGWFEAGPVYVGPATYADGERKFVPAIDVNSPTLRYNLAAGGWQSLKIKSHLGRIVRAVWQTLEPQLPAPPAMTASISSFPLSGTPPLAVSLTGSQTNGTLPLSWLWEFGDGSASSTSASPVSHTFVSPGTYTVTLTITGADARSATASVNVTATSPPPPPPPTIYVLDNFSDADETPLTSHTPDTRPGSAMWSVPVGDEPYIYSNRLETYAISSNFVAMIGSGQSNVRIRLDVVSIGLNGFRSGIAARVANGSNYLAGYVNSPSVGAKFIEIWKCEGGTLQMLTQIAVSAVPSTLTMTVNGNNIVLSDGTVTCTAVSSFNNTQTYHGILCTGSVTMVCEKITIDSVP